MQNINTLSQVNELQAETLVWAVVIVLVAILIAFIVANLFPYQGGHDRSYVKRRIAFIIIGIVQGFGFWIYNRVAIMPKISNAGFQDMYGKTNLQCLLITLLGYFIIGVVLMVVFRHTKFGSILGIKDNK